MRQTTWTPVYFIAQLFYFIALVRRSAAGFSRLYDVQPKNRAGPYRWYRF